MAANNDNGIEDKKKWQQLHWNGSQWCQLHWRKAEDAAANDKDALEKRKDAAANDKDYIEEKKNMWSQKITLLYSAIMGNHLHSS